MILIDKILSHAKDNSLSEKDISTLIDVDQSYLTKWKKGDRLPPDPRKKENARIYKKIAELLNYSYEEAVADVVIYDEENKFKYILEAKPNLNVDIISKLSMISKNIENYPEAIDLITNTLKEYVKIKGGNWRR